MSTKDDGGSSDASAKYQQQLFPPSGSGPGNAPDLSGGDLSGMSWLHAAADVLSPAVLVTSALTGHLGGKVRGQVEAAMKGCDPDKIDSFATIWDQTAGDLQGYLTDLQNASGSLSGAWAGDDANTATQIVGGATQTLTPLNTYASNFSQALHNISTNLASCKSSWGHDTSTGGGIVNAVTGNQDSDAGNDYNQLIQTISGDLQIMPQSVTAQVKTTYAGTQTPSMPTTPTSGVPSSPNLPGAGGAPHYTPPPMQKIPKTPVTTTKVPKGKDPHDPLDSIDPHPPGIPHYTPVHGGGGGVPGGSGFDGSGGYGGGGLGDGTSLAGLADGAGKFGAGGGLGAGDGSAGLGSAGLGGGAANGLGAGSGAGGANGGAAGAGGRGLLSPMHGGGNGNDQERERSTWLEEDDDVWGADDAPPPVIDG